MLIFKSFWGVFSFAKQISKCLGCKKPGILEKSRIIQVRLKKLGIWEILRQYLEIWEIIAKNPGIYTKINKKPEKSGILN